MDDSYICCPNLKYAQAALDYVIMKYEHLGIGMNPNKTRIVPIFETIIFLKKRIWIDTSVDKSHHTPLPEDFEKWKEKIKRMYYLYEDGKIPIERVRKSFKSKYGTMISNDTIYECHKMKQLYFKLFHEGPDGETLEDIRIRKNIPMWKHQVDTKEITMKETTIMYQTWRDGLTWNKIKENIVKDNDRLFKQTFGKSIAYYNYIYKI